MTRRKTITLSVTLEFDDELPTDDDCDFTAIEAFLRYLPERYGRFVTLNDARVTSGMVDREGVPVERKGVL